MNSTYYWWDCYSGQDEAKAIGGGANKSGWGWTRGGKNYAKYARPFAGGIFGEVDPTDGNNIAMVSVVVYEICRNGCLVTEFRRSDMLNFSWCIGCEKWYLP